MRQTWAGLWMFRSSVYLVSTVGFVTCLASVGCSDDDATRPSKSSQGAAETESKDAASSADAAKDSGKDSQGPAQKPRWTMMGYDAKSNYFQPHETKLSVDNAKDLKEQWRVQTSGFPAGSPVIVDDKVFISATGGMIAVELATGKELWSQPMVRGTATPAYHEGFLYMHAASGAQLYKLDARDGSIVWGPVKTYPQNDACDGTSSPIVAGELVLVGHSCGGAEVGGGPAQAAAKGGVEALRMDDGSREWTYWTVADDETGAMVWSTVAVDLEDKVIFATTGNNYTKQGEHSDAIHAIDLLSGERKWFKQVRDGDLWSIDASRMVFGTGKDTDFGANPILATVNGRKVVAAGDKAGAFWMLDRESGEIVWAREKLSDSFAANTGGVLMNGAFDGKYFYAALNNPDHMPPDAYLRVLDPKDGEDVREPKHLDGLVWGAPSLANGLIVVPVNSRLLVLDAASGDELAQFETGGTIAGGAAAIADGKIVVKSGLQYGFGVDLKDNHEVICYGLGDPPAGAVSGSDNHNADAGAAGKDSFTAVYNDVIAATGCAGSSLCHAGEAGNLTMKDRDSTYKALVDVKAMGKNAPGSGAAESKNCADLGVTRVVPGKPDESLLVKKLEGTQPCGDQMPIGNKLSDEQISQVRAWIEHGAKDD